MERRLCFLDCVRVSGSRVDGVAVAVQAAEEGVPVSGDEVCDSGMNKMMHKSAGRGLSFNEFRNLCMSKEKQASDSAFPLMIYVARPLSYLPAFLFVKLGINPNQATVITICISVLGASLVGSGRYLFVLIGAVVSLSWIVFDCVDGNIARYLTSRGESASAEGGFVDSLSSDISYALVFSSAGIGAYNLATGGKSVVWIILGFSASLCMVLYRLTSIKTRLYRERFTDRSKKTPAASSASHAKSKVSQVYSWLNRFRPIIRYHVFGQGGFLFPFLIVFSLVKRLDLFVLLSFTMLFSALSLEIISSVRQLKSLNSC